jgi:hypothetical protein
MNKKMNASVQAYNNSEIKHNDCLSCHEAIFNPICPECILKQFRSWTKIHPGLKKVEQIIVNFVNKHRIFNKNSQTCITCKKHSSYLCPYCFTEYIFNLLKKARLSRALIGEFLFLFNYDLEHTGYYKEGERLGVF